MSGDAPREAAAAGGRDEDMPRRTGRWRGQAGRLIALMQRPDVRGMAVVILSKGVMVLLNFTLITLAARSLDTVNFGYYSVLYSAAALLYIVAAAGQELFVIRSWNEFIAAGDAARLKGVLRFTALISICGSLVVSACFFPWAQASFGAGTAAAATTFLVLASMVQITMHLVRTSIGVGVGDGLGNFLSAGPAIVYLALCLLTGRDSSLGMLFVFLALGSSSALMLHLTLIRRLLRRIFPEIGSVAPVSRHAEWLGRSLRLWGANTTEAINQYMDVLVIGYLMNPTVAGAYFVTVRLANLFAAAADSINLFATRHFSGLYHRGERERLEEFLNSLAWITLAFICAGMVGIAIGGYFALLIINEAYTAYFPELLVLCFGTAALAIARPCGSILMLTGHESRYLQVIAGSAALRLAALFLLIPQFGVMGAVIASALSFIAAALVLWRLAVSLTGLDATVFRLFPRWASQTQANAAE